MTLSIGAVSFDGGTGTPYPRLSDGDIASWVAGAKDYRYAGSPPTGQGEMNVWSQLSESAAVAKLALVAGYVGSDVVITYPHGVIGPVTVAAVDGAWQAAKGGSATGVLVVKVRFDYSVSKDGTDEQRSLVTCQTSPALAGPWTTRPKWGCLGSADGLGTYAGEAQARAVDELPDQTAVGLWVRLVLKSALPAIDVKWVGVVMKALGNGRRNLATGAGWGTESTYQFAGVAAALAALNVGNWREARDGTAQQGAEPYPPSVGGIADIGQAFDFNAGGGRDRSSIKQALNAVDVYLPARGLLSSGDKWTATDALQYVYECFQTTYSTLPKINFSLPGLLDYSDTWPASSRSLLDIIATIISPQAMRTFRIDTTTGEIGTAASAFFTIVPIDLTDAGTQIDLTGPAVSNWASSCDGSAVADRWYLDAGKRTYMATFKLSKTEATNVDFVRGWQSSLSALWDAASETERDNQKLASVWRKWSLKQTWKGHNGSTPAITSLIPYHRSTDPGPGPTTGQETGELDEGLVPPPYPNAPVAWLIERTIPAGPGVDWVASVSPNNANIINQQTPVDGPLLWWVKADVAPFDPISNGELSVTIGDNYASVTLGNSSIDAKAIKEKMDAGYDIYTTLSFIHPLNWRATRNVVSPRSDMIRTIYTELPQVNQHRVDFMPSTIIGLDSSSAPIIALAGRRDQGPDLPALRDRFAPWYTTNDNGGQWQVDSVATLTPLPGAIVSGLLVVRSTTPLVTGVIPMGAPITRRSISWDRWAPSVSWTVSRIAPTLTNNGKGVVVLGNGVQGLGRSAVEGGVGVNNV